MEISHRKKEGDRARPLYVLTPLDVIPDFIPIAGFIDDAAVIAVVLKLSGGDLARYRAWRREQENTIDVG